MTWPVTICDSSLASQATTGELPAGSIGWYSSSGISSGSTISGAPGMVAVMRVAPPGTDGVDRDTQSSELDRLSVSVRPAMAALAVA